MADGELKARRIIHQTQERDRIVAILDDMRSEAAGDMEYRRAEAFRDAIDAIKKSAAEAE